MRTLGCPAMDLPKRTTASMPPPSWPGLLRTYGQLNASSSGLENKELSEWEAGYLGFDKCGGIAVGRTSHLSVFYERLLHYCSRGRFSALEKIPPQGEAA